MSSSGFPIVNSPATLTDCSGTINAGVSSVVIASGGSGYIVNDIIGLANGVLLKVLAVSSGVITSVSINFSGSLSYAASLTFTNPATQASTTGSGSGAAFNISWGAGVPTLMLAANSNRHGFRIQNQSQSEMLWFNDIGTSVTPFNAGSYALAQATLYSPGGYYDGLSVGAIWLYGATPGHVFSAAWY